MKTHRDTPHSSGSSQSDWAARIARARRHARDVLRRSSIITWGKIPNGKYLPKVDGKATWKPYQNRLPDDDEIERHCDQMETAISALWPKTNSDLPGIALVPQAGQVHIDWDDLEQLIDFCRLYYNREEESLTVVRSLAGGHTHHDLPDGVVMRCSGKEETIPELDGVGVPNRIKGHGGLTAAPPSYHVDDSTLQYRWMRFDPDEDDLVECGPPQEPPPEAPAWFVAWLSPFIKSTATRRNMPPPRYKKGDSPTEEEAFRQRVAPWLPAQELERFVTRARGRPLVYWSKRPHPPGAATDRNEDLHDYMSREARIIPEAGIDEVLEAYSTWKHQPPLGRSEIEWSVAQSGKKYVTRAREQTPTAGAGPQEVDLRVFTLADRVMAPERSTRALAEHIIPAPGKVVLYGPGGSYKTWVACDLAVAVATGGKWGGEFQCERGPVLFLEAEMSAVEITKRLRSVAAAHDVRDIEQLPIALSTQRHRIITQDQYKTIHIITEVESAWRQAIEEHRPSLLIVDSLSAVYSAEETNTGFKTLDDLLTRLIADYDLTVVLIHHTPKRIAGREQGLPRGSTVLRDAADTLLLLEKDGLIVKKQRLFQGTGETYSLLTWSEESVFSIRLRKGRISAKKRILWEVEQYLIVQDYPVTKRHVRRAISGDNAVIDEALGVLTRSTRVALVRWNGNRRGYHHYRSSFDGDYEEINPS